MSETIAGLLSVCNAPCLLLMAAGTILGIIFGALPGLSATMGIALCLSLTYSMSSVEAISLLIGIYIGGISGGLVSAILINVPGTASSIATCFDGHPMAERGEAGRALGVGLFASLIGTVFSFIILINLAPTLAKFTLKFGPYEYFAICLFSLTLIGTLISGTILKGLASGVLGVLLGCVGVAQVTGTLRFTFGITELSSGFGSTPAMVGIFAIGAMLSAVMKGFENDGSKIAQYKLHGFGLSKKEIVEQLPNFLRSALIGTGIGILPGIGGGTSNLVAYGIAKSSSKYPEKFGTGIIDGIIASETSNNASIGGALIPLMTVGIPGDTVTAMLLGALTIQGLTPGPLLFKTDAGFVNGLFAAVLISTIMMVIFEYFGMKPLVKILGVPRYELLPIVMAICMVGVFASNNRVFDLWTMLFFGILGFVLSRFGFPTAPVILGFIIGPYMEQYMLRAVMVGRGSLMGIFQRPIAVTFLALTVLSVAFTVYKELKAKKAKEETAE